MTQLSHTYLDAACVTLRDLLFAKSARTHPGGREGGSWAHSPGKGGSDTEPKPSEEPLRGPEGVFAAPLPPPRCYHELETEVGEPWTDPLLRLLSHSSTQGKGVPLALDTLVTVSAHLLSDEHGHWRFIVRVYHPAKGSREVARWFGHGSPEYSTVHDMGQVLGDFTKSRIIDVIGCQEELPMG